MPARAAAIAEGGMAARFRLPGPDLRGSGQGPQPGAAGETVDSTHSPVLARARGGLS